MQAFIGIIALGLLGLDPIGAILIVSAMVARARKYKVLLFAATFILGTTALGVVLSLLGKGAIDYLQSFVPDGSSPLWAMLSLIVIAVIIIWLTVRFLRRNEPRPKKRRKKPLFGSTWQFIITGLLFALSAFADPTFYAVIVIAAETHNVIAMTGLHLTWITISQIPLIAVILAYLLNAHKPFLKFNSKLWRAHKEKVMAMLYSAAIILALGLLVDISVYVFTGEYLFY